MSTAVCQALAERVFPGRRVVVVMREDVREVDQTSFERTGHTAYAFPSDDHSSNPRPTDEAVSGSSSVASNHFDPRSQTIALDALRAALEARLAARA
jgi:hypothetical protein